LDRVSLTSGGIFTNKITWEIVDLQFI
jgi:hypothetical protein